LDIWFSEINHIYRESPWLLFPELDWSPLTVGLKPDTFRKGSFIYHQNQASKYVFIIKTGRVNISIINADGKVRSIFICGDGAMFGEISHFLTPENCAQAQAVSESVIFKIDKARYQEKFRIHTTIAHNTAVILAKKVRAMTAHMESMMFPDATKRVANILLYLAGQYGKTCDSGIQLTIKFSHQEVANLIGMSRVTVTNSFRQLEEKGVIGKTAGYVYILNKEQLLEMLKW
jgi:CRP-like cAMP-binding protein